MSGERIKLKPCPFCGSKSVHFTTDGKKTWVICLSCGARSWIVENGPRAAAIAAELWNRRAYDIQGRK